MSKLTLEDMAQLPDFAELVRRLGTPDAVFERWRDETNDKHWAHFDLSALRIGYELGKYVSLKAQGEPVATYKQIGWVHPIYIGTNALAMDVSTVHLAEAQLPVFIRTGAVADDRPTWEEVQDMIEAGCRATDVNDPAMPTEIAENIIAEFRKEKGK